MLDQRNRARLYAQGSVSSCYEKELPGVFFCLIDDSLHKGQTIPHEIQ